ncbi:hypothetical protein SETIT_9G027700v2 [Setaria italica]|uniref:Uncharacterized protein n=1 Tax=Setaria italica TaxID=4555 RepID=K4AGD5_SETIT|nr:uncharacterized protein LOC101779043 [Setaria italica]RCV40137.1 hypothetical protein SETIT_9G027700v2 [Setaria italica]RCV40138.1 hypothetical protein SETIT_9G027700v2 [Setaria italica]
MGSLMAGWDSPVLGDDKKVHARRNRSLTKEEVEAFWKQRRRSEDGGELTSPLASPATESPFGTLEKAARSPGRGGASSPRVRVDGFLPGDDDGAAADSPSKSRDWWTRSNWAFLNEPPQEEPASRAQNYTPQFHVARIATGNA